MHCMGHHSLEHTGGGRGVVYPCVCGVLGAPPPPAVSLVPGQSQSGEENYIKNTKAILLPPNHMRER